MIYLQAVQYGLRLIIITQYQFLSTLITDALLLGRNVLDMIGCAAGQTCASAGHSLHDILIGNIYVDRKINRISQLGQCLVQYLCLRNGSGKSIQYIAVLAIILCNSV